MIAFAKLTWMAWITHSSVEIENSVESAAGTNPLIHRQTRRFAILAVVVSAFVRGQCSAEHLDSMLMSAFDDLL